MICWCSRRGLCLWHASALNHGGTGVLPLALPCLLLVAHHPYPPLIPQVKEWLCLNCQMQRALGMDMTTAPRSKSQQQLHSPSPSPSHSPAKLPAGQEKTPAPTQPSARPGTAATAVPPPEPPRAQSAALQREQHGQPKAAAPPEAARASLQHQQAKPSSSEQRKALGDPKPAALAPGAGAAEQPQEGLTGKLFGFGASLLTQASTLMSVQPEAPAPSPQASGKVPPKIVFSDASKEAGPKAGGAQGWVGAAKASKAEPGVKPKEVPKARVLCPLCKAEINVGSAEPPNYNACTSCRQQVCNMCGFNPAPHLVEVRGRPARLCVFVAERGLVWVVRAEGTGLPGKALLVCSEQFIKSQC